MSFFELDFTKCFVFFVAGRDPGDHAVVCLGRSVAAMMMMMMMMMIIIDDR